MKIKTIKRPWVKSKPSYGNKKDVDPYYHTKDWKQRRKAHIENNPYCALCDKKGRITLCYPPPLKGVVDHIVPRKKGGSDNESNLQTLCIKCNAAKTANDK